MDKGSILIADCIVTYDGRAKSVLERGRYLIIYKVDGSLAIHGMSLIKPLNYISSGSVLNKQGNILIWTKKKESIKVEIMTEIYYQPFDLSHHVPVMMNTEKQLVEKLVQEWKEHGLKGTPVLEQKTRHGPVDIYSLHASEHTLVEVKRKNITLKDITQVLRYKETFEGSVLCYVAGPGISKNAMTYAEKHAVKFIKINF